MGKKDNFFNRSGFLELERETHIRQADIARELGVSRTTVYNWEAGVKTPTPKHIEALARIFKVESDFLTGKSRFRSFEEKIMAASDEYYDIIEFARDIVWKWLELNGYHYIRTVCQGPVETIDHNGKKIKAQPLYTKEGMCKTVENAKVLSFILSKDKKAVDYGIPMADIKAKEIQITEKDLRFFPVEIMNYIEMRLKQMTYYHHLSGKDSVEDEINTAYFDGIPIV